jgi:uncharacterized protein (DUF433 family)
MLRCAQDDTVSDFRITLDNLLSGVTMHDVPIWRGHIESRPGAMVGKAGIRGTRVTVEAILDAVSITGTVAETAAESPRVTEENVRTAVVYAIDALNNDVAAILIS